MLTNSYSTSIAGPRSCASPWSSLPVPASRGTAVARRAPLAYAKRRGPGSRTTGANNTGDKPPPVPGPADGPKPSSDSGAASGGASSAPPKWGGDNKWWVNPPARLRASNRGEVAVADFDMEPRWIETAAKVLLDAGAIASHPVSATLQKIQQRSGVIVWCAVNGPWRMEVVLVDDVRAPLAMRLLRAKVVAVCAAVICVETNLFPTACVVENATSKLVTALREEMERLPEMEELLGPLTGKSGMLDALWIPPRRRLQLQALEP